MLPKTFTAFQWLQAGSGICKRCYTFLKSPEIRRSGWIIVGDDMELDNVQFLKDPLKTLPDPPNPPFRFYLTKQKRKHGWVRLIFNPALSRENFPVAFEEDLIHVNLKTAQQMHVLAKRLLEARVPKWELLRGISVSRAVRCHIQPEDLEAVSRNRRNPLWEVVVKFE